MRQFIHDRIFQGTMEENAQLCRDGANKVSMTRNKVAAVVAENIITLDMLYPLIMDYGTKRGAAVVASLGASDKVDGMIARYGFNHFGLKPSKATDELDPLLDKEFNRLMMTAFSTRSELQGHLLYSNILEWILAETEERDIKMNEARANAPLGQTTQASLCGKAKTFVQNTGHTLAMSPYNRTTSGRAVILGTYSAALALGEISLVQGVEQYAGKEMPTFMEATKTVFGRVKDNFGIDLGTLVQVGDLGAKYDRIDEMLLNPVTLAV